MARKTNKDADNASFHGSIIRCTPARLKELFPDSYYEDNTGEDKVNLEFTLETENGNVFTIYDWKLYYRLREDAEYDFHIGAYSEYVSEKAADEIFELL